VDSGPVATHDSPIGSSVFLELLTKLKEH